jgi:hypothetical protein
MLGRLTPVIRAISASVACGFARHASLTVARCSAVNRSSTGVCPAITTCRGLRNRRGRVHPHHLAGDQPVEQVPDRGEPLLDARRGELAISAGSALVEPLCGAKIG